MGLPAKLPTPYLQGAEPCADGLWLAAGLFQPQHQLLGVTQRQGQLGETVPEAVGQRQQLPQPALLLLAAAPQAAPLGQQLRRPLLDPCGA